MRSPKFFSFFKIYLAILDTLNAHINFWISLSTFADMSLGIFIGIAVNQ
jgi:hypothetical protein